MGIVTGSDITDGEPKKQVQGYLNQPCGAFIHAQEANSAVQQHRPDSWRCITAIKIYRVACYALMWLRVHHIVGS